MTTNDPETKSEEPAGETNAPQLGVVQRGENFVLDAVQRLTEWTVRTVRRLFKGG